MEFKFSDNVKESIPSLIREVGFRGASIPNFINLAIGNPASEAIPVELIKEACASALSDNPITLLQYGNAQGSADFRNLLISKLTGTMRLEGEGNDILITSGSQQGLDVTPRLLCNPGDGVFVDEFTFTGALNAIRNCGGVPIPVKMDKHGMIPEELEKQIKAHKGTYIYVIPNFQNPTGITMPLERRKEIYAIASNYNLAIYEDNPYGRLRYEGEDIPAFKHLDTEHRVIYAGSFSKVVSAGLRVGFLYGPSEFIKKATVIKNGADSQTSAFNQAIVTYILNHVNYEEYIRGIVNVYRKKWVAMKSALDIYCADVADIHVPDGGMFFWITIPEYMNPDEVYEYALSKGIGIVRSLAFAADMSNPGHSFRLSFSYSTVDEIERAVKILGEVLHHFVR